MPRPEYQAEHLSPPAALFQAQALVESLGEYRGPKYPEQVVRVSRILAIIAECVVDRLNQYVKEGEGLTDDHRADVFDLARIIQDLYSRLRFLQVADTASCPPGVQIAISLLVDEFVPRVLGCKKADVAVLVRPRWSYSPLFVDFYGDLRPIRPASLDPNATGELRAFVASRWNLRRGADAASPSDVAPQFVAILSFAGLDRDDVLLYPLLAHEIGHFLDYSFPGHISHNPEVLPNAWVPERKDLTRVLPGVDPDDLTGYQQFLDEQRRLSVRFSICLRELTADLIATRMLGVSYAVAFCEYFKLVSGISEPDILDNGYPGFPLRMKVILDELCDPEGMNALALLESQAGNDAIQHTFMYIKTAAEIFRGDVEPTSSNQFGDAALNDLIIKKIKETLPALKRFLRDKIITKDDAAAITPHLPKLVQFLRNRVPPAQASAVNTETPSIRTWVKTSFAERFTAAWMYELLEGEDRELSLPDTRAQRAEYQRTCNLLLKSMELETFLIDQPAPPVVGQSNPDRQTGGSALAEPEISRRIFFDRTDPLFVIPVPKPEQIQTASLDLRLGNWFRTFKQTSLRSVDLADKEQRRLARSTGQVEMYIPKSEEFVLHPGDFALGVSLEYFGFPADLMGEVEGKSGLGRTGLIIATAAPVAPGFRGCIVLELCNAGTVPLVLRPGMDIAQLVFTTVSSRMEAGKTYRGDYQCQIKP